MKRLLIFLTLILVAFLVFNANAQSPAKEAELKGKVSSLVITRQIPVIETTKTTEYLPDSTKKETIITITAIKKVQTRVDASRQFVLGLGSSPETSQLNQALVAQGNSAVSDAMANVINANPDKIDVLKQVPNPANRNDQRIIYKVDFMTYPYYYSANRHSVYYGPDGRGRWIPARTFEAYLDDEEEPPLF